MAGRNISHGARADTGSLDGMWILRFLDTPVLETVRIVNRHARFVGWVKSVSLNLAIAIEAPEPRTLWISWRCIAFCDSVHRRFTENIAVTLDTAKRKSFPLPAMLSQASYA
eukprot:5525193-Amphidinium_carterae.1